MSPKKPSNDGPTAPKDVGKFRRIPVRRSSESGEIRAHRRYRVRVDGRWYEGEFSRQWFGWQFDGYRNGIQLNLVDEVLEIREPRQAIRPHAGQGASVSSPDAGPPT